ncbi:MAG: esterase family protein [Lachnospiraceae bacterium]|nr:esterase family protein [Lachnospiraceae bacterium]
MMTMLIDGIRKIAKEAGRIMVTAVLTTALLCACGTVTQEQDTQEEGKVAEMAETTEMEEVTEDRNEPDKSKFATGITTEETGSEAASREDDHEDAAETELTDAIVERCPAAYTATRSDVAYGEYSHGTYYSETCGMERGYSILLPADYSEEKKYPVLYLLHGIFGDEYSFSGDAGNRIREIVGNMAADGYIEETIVVCPNMYAATDPDQKPAFDVEACLPYDNFINDLTVDLMPHIESKYAVLTGREHTYLAGFSMGGRETIYITLQRPELFGYVCAISAAPGIVPTTDKFMTHPGQMAESEMKFAEGAVTPEVFLICCGTRDSVVGTYPRSYHELLDANGSEHIWYEINGADHDNNAIQSGIYNLFRQIACDRADS